MSRRVVILGDVGVRSEFHLGDEAMLEAAMSEIGSRVDVRWTAVSGEPAETAGRYGVAAVPGFGFGDLAGVDAREARLAQLSAAVSGGPPLPDCDESLPLLDAIADADAVLIAGGGNLNSGWPPHVYERAALAVAARLMGVPLLISGQTLGPYLTRRDGELVSATVTGAQLVGVRERASADIAARLGVPPERIRCAADDAAFTFSDARPFDLPDFDVRPGEFVAVTLSSFAGPYLATDLVQPFADYLQRVRALTGLDIVLIPHVGRPDWVAGENSDDDVHYHRAIAAAAGAGVRQAPLLTSDQAVWLTRQAAMVVSSRYHPVVFALAAGLPTLAITVDDYTGTKLTGAAELVGMSGWCVSILGLFSGVLDEAVAELWRCRDAVTGWLDERVPELRADKRRYWDEFAEVVVGRPAAVDRADPAVSEPFEIRGAWVRRNVDAMAWQALYAARQIDWRSERADDAAVIHRLTEALGAESVAGAELADVVTVLEESLVTERSGADAARALNARLLDDLGDSTARSDRLEAELTAVASVRQAESEQLASLQDELARLISSLGHATGELQSLHRTKLLRWSRRPRALYRRLRK